MAALHRGKTPWDVSEDSHTICSNRRLHEVQSYSIIQQNYPLGYHGCLAVKLCILRKSILSQMCNKNTWYCWSILIQSVRIPLEEFNLEFPVPDPSIQYCLCRWLVQDLFIQSVKYMGLLWSRIRPYNFASSIFYYSCVTLTRFVKQK